MLTFQELAAKLLNFWSDRGCVVHQGYDLEVGAGTFNPATFMRCLGPEPYKTAYIEPSRRPQDARYGDNPNRVHLFHQFQVILKPSPLEVQELYLQSLREIGLDLSRHDIRFVHDDWEGPTLGAWGLGWEVWIDGMEITQFTYFQSIGGYELDPIPVEITYGLERLCMFVQDVDSIFDIKWSHDLTFRDISHQNEVEWSRYGFTEASSDMWYRHFGDFEEEAKKLLQLELPIPAYDFVMKASHAFNILEARGTLSVTERTGYIARIRALAHLCATSYLKTREKMQYPLLRALEEKRAPFPLNLGSLSFDPAKKSPFLLEIGAEELPATFIPIGMRNLKQAVEKLLKEEGIPHGAVHVYGAPRRLAISIADVACGTEDQRIKKKGPPLTALFDATGETTAQGKGFFKGLGLTDLNLFSLDEHPALSVESDYLMVTSEQKGKSTLEILAKKLPSLISGLHFPKKMRWSTHKTPFARPIHWLVALLDTQIIPFEIEGIISGRVSYGHRQRANTPLTIHHAHTYVETLREGAVMVDPTQRKASIEKQLKELEEASSSYAIEKDRVMSEVLYLSEWPELALGLFNPSFLRAPAQVLVCEMVNHQRYFPLVDKEGELTNQFVITADNHLTPEIIHGNQKVLSARLSDGTFLYQEDCKSPLSEFAPLLESVTFHKDLGSIGDKVRRIEKHAHFLSSLLHVGEKKVLEAAALCKADLTTSLVSEFPELQGTIGHHYALKSGVSSDIALAIEEHWKPRFDGDALPQDALSTLLSIADKSDNLLGYFSAGIRPSSSSDPYALRRIAFGLLRMIIEKKLPLDLERYFLAVQAIYPSTPPLSEIHLFLTERLRSLLEEYQLDKQTIAAVLDVKWSSPYSLYCKAEALQALRKTPGFAELLEVYKRARGHLGESADFGSVNPHLLKEEAEKTLFAHFNSQQKAWKEALAGDDYREVFSLLSTFKQPLAHLFDSVRILDSDESIKNNRLALLQAIVKPIDALANLKLCL